MPRMAISGPDHFTILTSDMAKTRAFYADTLGLAAGPRPAFDFPGARLHCDGAPLLHGVQRDAVTATGGVIDHIAFRGAGLPDFPGNLRALGVSFDLRRLPEGGSAGGLWQVFFTDPNGARIEANFSGSQTP